MRKLKMPQGKGSGKSFQTPGKNHRRLLIFLAIWFALSMLFAFYQNPGYQKISYTTFKKEVKGGNVGAVRLKGKNVTGEFKSETTVGEGKTATETTFFKTVLPAVDDPGLMSLLESKGVTVNVVSNERSWGATLLIYLLPWVLIIGFFVWSSRKFRQGMGGGQGLFGFGRSKAKRFDKSKSEVGYSDVAGLGGAKKELAEVVDFLRDPSRFTRLGAKLPRGVLLAGPPGTGKTLLAKATAGEADAPFFNISGSEFIEMFVGVGAARVRDMFTQAKKEAPAIIFIDEIDSIGRVRGTGLGGGHDEREQTLNQILNEMDGFQPHESVIVLAATNRSDVLDPALVRPGRFDRRITLDLPSKADRKEILKIHAKKISLADNVDFDRIAGTTVGFSGADLENVVNEAALIAGRKEKEIVEGDDFDEGLDKIRMGLAREDLLTDTEKRIVAYHESGHALMTKLLENVDPLNKVTIIPHGRALGVTEQIPEDDRHNQSREYLLNRLAVMLGGRASERVALEDISTGAENDLMQATEMARRMICRWGMNETLGPVFFKMPDSHPFLGKEIAQSKDFSEDTARRIDTEIRELLVDIEKKTEEMLTQHLSALNALAEALIDRETLDAEEIEEILEAQSKTMETKQASAK